MLPLGGIDIQAEPVCWTLPSGKTECWSLQEFNDASENMLAMWIQETSDARSRGIEAIAKYLPPKYEMVVFCSLTDAQKITQVSECQACTNDTYSSSQGYGPCHARKTSCPAGEYFTAAADNTADHTCSPCADTHYKEDDNADIECTAKKTTCPAGTTHLVDQRSS